MNTFQQLAEVERLAREERIANALKNGGKYGRDFRESVAEELYSVVYDKPTNYFNELDHRVILDKFCNVIFGASFEEVLKAYDRYLN